jgi:hypothetical protein
MWQATAVAWGMRLASGLRQLPATARVAACWMASRWLTIPEASLLRADEVIE